MTEFEEWWKLQWHDPDSEIAARRKPYAQAAWEAAAKAERARCALRVALHSQYPITTDFDRGYDKARKDAADELRAG